MSADYPVAEHAQPEVKFPLERLTQDTQAAYLKAIFMGQDEQLSQTILEQVLDNFALAAQANQEDEVGLRTTCTEFEKLVAPGMWMAAQGKDNSQAALRLIEPVLVAARVAYWGSDPKTMQAQFTTAEKALAQRYEQAGTSGVYDRALAFYQGLFRALNADPESILYNVIEFKETGLWTGEVLQSGHQGPEYFLENTSQPENPATQIINLKTEPMQPVMLRVHQLIPEGMLE